jgi:hypothetical protein
MLDAIAVLPRRELSSGPLTGIDPKTRALDVLVIDDRLAVVGRDVVATRVIRNFDDFPEELGPPRFGAGSPADFKRHLPEEVEKWGKVIRAVNIKPD